MKPNQLKFIIVVLVLLLGVSIVIVAQVLRKQNSTPTNTDSIYDRVDELVRFSGNGYEFTMLAHEYQVISGDYDQGNIVLMHPNKKSTIQITNSSSLEELTMQRDYSIFDSSIGYSFTVIEGGDSEVISSSYTQRAGIKIGTAYVTNPMTASYSSLVVFKVDDTYTLIQFNGVDGDEQQKFAYDRLPIQITSSITFTE